MNKLEQQIADAIVLRLNSSERLPDDHFARPYAEVAAKIALELAEKAYRVGRAEAGMGPTRNFEEFKKEVL